MILPALNGLSIQGQKTLWDALWRTDTKEGHKALVGLSKSFLGNNKLYTESLLKKKSPRIDISNPVEPKDLDSNWIRFIVSGKQEYVFNVIKSLNSTSSAPSSKKILAAAANWSLSSNCEQHKKVFEIVQRQADVESNPIIKQALKTIIMDVQKRIKSGEVTSR